MPNYDLTEAPPAPCLDVKIINPALNVSYAHRGKIDTGASLTVIPTFIVDELTLQPRGTAVTRSFRHDEPERIHLCFYVNVELAGYSFSYVKVIESVRPDILLGRNILNKVRLVLDGKNLSFKVSDP